MKTKIIINKAIWEVVQEIEHGRDPNPVLERNNLLLAEATSNSAHISLEEGKPKLNITDEDFYNMIKDEKDIFNRPINYNPCFGLVIG